MKKVVFSVSPFVESLEILGEDGEVYFLQPNSVVILPELNAKALERANYGRIVGEFRQPERNLDELLHQQKDIGEYDILKDWAKMMLEAELRKPHPDPDKVLEYKMLISGINPTTAFHPKDNKEPIKTTQRRPTHSYPTSPTGLCSPSNNTVQVGNFDNEYKEENKSGLRDVFEIFGLRCVTTLQAFRVRGLDEIDLEGYSILDYGYTRVELHQELRKLLREFGYDERDFRLVLLFDEYRCEKHGRVFKPVIDWEMRFVDADGERRRQLRVHAGRIHPLKKYGDSKRYSAQKLEQIKLIASAMRQKGIIGYREFDGELKQVRHFESDLALLWLVFTVPERMSKGLRDYILARPEEKGRVEELMRKATRRAIEKFLRKYLKKHENVPLKGEFKIGGMMNVHLWSSSSPVNAHVHNHVCLWNVVVCNGQIIRFSPYIGKEWLRELRRIWRDEFFALLRKRRYEEIKVWTDPFVEEDYELFNVYNAYTWLNERGEDGELENAGKIVHHLRYNSRKAIVDLNEFFYSGVKAEDLSRSDKEWVEYLVEYSNRTSNFGFMNNWRQIFGVSREDALRAVERARREHYEYCPICKRRLEYVGTVTVDEIAKCGKLLVLWWFDRRMNVEVWRRDLVTEKGAPGPGFEPESRAFCGVGVYRSPTPRQARMIGRTTPPGHVRYLSLRNCVFKICASFCG